MEKMLFEAFECIHKSEHDFTLDLGSTGKNSGVIKLKPIYRLNLFKLKPMHS